MSLIEVYWYVPKVLSSSSTLTTSLAESVEDIVSVAPDILKVVISVLLTYTLTWLAVGVVSKVSVNVEVEPSAINVCDPL